ncbi:LamG-like jellyroll fold domain-containing protein [Cellvibrio fontiphilus]|uniref:beta-fructofuranosidase n=1 Tax=Cellvibrio fontiphilus TaxID=1815559 RepID=A0ABV7FJR5_9GAMM
MGSIKLSRLLGLALTASLLLACWPARQAPLLVKVNFDEGAGTQLREVVSGRDYGIQHRFREARYKPVSDPYWRSHCIAGQCLKFDGSSNAIELAPLVMPASGVITLSLWVAPQAYEWGDGGLPSGLLGQYQAAAHQGFVLGIGRHGEWLVQLGDGLETHTVTAGQRLPVDSWSHLALRIDKPAQTLAFYRNSELVAEHRLSALAQFQLPDTPLFIGRHPAAMLHLGHFYLHSFNGLMDELAVLDGALPIAEHQALYTRALADGQLPALSLADTTIARREFDGDKHRPQYHLMPDAHWMNEPHGPFYYQGKYHITFQKNPHGPFWHQIHWGHLVSDDMVHWREVDMALRPEAGDLTPDGVWSGSATLDAEGNPVLFFTAGNDQLFPTQRMALARPKDLTDPLLREWVAHPKALITQQPDWGLFGQFRDPFVFWDKTVSKWYQLVTSGIPDGSGTALVFSSSDLFKWDYLGPLFSTDIKAYPQVGPVWELPVLLPLGTGRDGRPRHWFGINSHGAGAVVEVYYWIGVWDAATGRFSPDHPEPRLMDIGDRKFTGPSGMVDPLTGRSILFSIAQGETTRQQEAESGWAHNGGLPLHLWLGEDDQLRFAPIAELASLRGEPLVDAANISGAEAQALLAPVKGDLLELELVLDAAQLVSTAGKGSLGLALRKNPRATELTRLNLLPRGGRNWRLELDRSRTSLDPDVLSYGVQGGDLVLDDEIRLRVFLDRSMLEVYVNDRASLTSRLFPATLDALGLGLELPPAAVVKRLRVWPMNAAQGDAAPVAPAAFDYSETTWQSALPNHDFSLCNLAGWQAQGEAFTPAQVVADQRELNPSGRIPGACQLLGSLAGGDATGELRSARFVLGGNGQLNFLIGGGMDRDNLYVALVDADTGQELMRATGTEAADQADGARHGLRRVYWDASSALGKTLYFILRDQSKGPRAYLNVDDFHIPMQSTLITETSL